MVITEAMSQGLPVITTSLAGGADFIRAGENGILVPARDSAALAEALAWCCENRQQLAAMGMEAHKTARSWQWSDYRREVARVVSDAVRSRGGEVTQHGDAARLHSPSPTRTVTDPFPR
jgi:glycosyltransferase involved in cell wall biosynthesis